jgi:hypothetical protein
VPDVVKNTIGQVIFTGIAEASARFYQIPTEKFAAGYYLATVTFESGARTVKILKQRN